jgi:manganese oxidase
LQSVTVGTTRFGQPKIEYDATFSSGPRKGDPVLAMLKGHEIIYSDLNAVIDVHEKARPVSNHEKGGAGNKAAEGEDCSNVPGPGSVCGRPYREFTAIFHDEITAIQAFPELEDEANPMRALRDGMAINYGSSGLGPMVIANKRRIGPARNCVECKLEEFFLTSWANGDPAMIVERDANYNALRALYPDDPSNVHHSYMGDPVRFRNMHAGPKETHVFHLHAHQWVQDKHDPNSVYLDSQTISPGAVFNYEIHYGGSGNRNFTVGDSIFHCHLYPHFAQGMWELWRSHDVFEAGTPDRNLPDGEIAGGTPNPAIVPLPDTAMPPMPTPELKGYPFFIAGRAGHRPPQPPKDLDRDPATGEVSDGGLPRHRFEDTTLQSAVNEIPSKDPADAQCLTPAGPDDRYERGKANAACIAGRVRKLNTDPNLVGLAQKLATARLTLLLPDPADPDGNDGTGEEKRAMDYHAGKAFVDGANSSSQNTPFGWLAKGYASCDPQGRCDTPQHRMLFHVNGSSGPKPGAPYADPCPKENGKDAPARTYRAAYVQLDMTVNKAGWHDPQARIAVLEQDVKDTFSGARPAEPLFFRARSGECVTFKATNLVPSALNLDDFQIFSPTDVLGQHIHLVKFDVTSSDGSGNGWNYEDGTLAADEVRERIAAFNRYQQSIGAAKRLTPKAHRLFTAGNMAGDDRGQCPAATDPIAWDSAEMAEKHPFCGAQTTVQRWWADPLLNKPVAAGGKDRTLRTVFTHDHFGPSSHQHHGLYAALVVEPEGSTWETLDGKTRLGTRTGSGEDGGPTSYSANIITPNQGTQCANEDPACIDREHTAREFNMAFADYALVYSTDKPTDKSVPNVPINPVNRVETELPTPTLHTGTPLPEGISTKDPGTQLINYRNEPIPLRISKSDPLPAGAKPVNPLACSELTDGSHACTTQRTGDGGDMANVFSSKVHQDQGDSGKQIFTEAIGRGRESGDPATPLLMAYAGDRVQVRLIQGAQEENHIFNMHGVKWLSQPESPNSGYMNAQPIGISEHFEFNVAIDPVSPQLDTDYLYSSTATDNLWDGQWGILRAFGWKKNGTTVPFLKRLPGYPRASDDARPASASGTPCPPGSPQREIAVSAVLARDWLSPERQDGKLVYNDHFGLTDPSAILFVRTKETLLRNGKEEVKCDEASTDPKVPHCSNKRRPEPLILRAAAGECLFVQLTNELPSEMPDAIRDASDPKTAEYQASWSYNSMPPTVTGFNFNQFASSNRVSLHPQLVALNGYSEDGSSVGKNEDSTVAPAPEGQKDCNIYHKNCKTYEWYAGDFDVRLERLDSGVETGVAHPAPIEFGAIALRDMGDVIKHSSHGAIGALVIEPERAAWMTDLEKGIGNQATHPQPSSTWMATG